MRTLVFILLSLLGFFAEAQNEANEWAIGTRSKLSFNSTEAQFMSLGDTLGRFNESQSFICDNNGQLKYFSSHDVLYNSQFDTIYHDSLANYWNDSHNSIILYHKASESYYYIRQDHYNYIQYFDPVWKKDHVLNTRAFITAYKILKKKNGRDTLQMIYQEEVKNSLGHTAHLSATFHSNNRDIWVSTYVNHDIWSYLLTEDGFSKVSKSPFVLPRIYDIGINDMHFSPSGNLFAIAASGAGGYHSNLSLWDFNRTTGEFSKPRQVRYICASGVEFSQDEESLLVNVNKYTQITMKGMEGVYIIETKDIDNIHFNDLPKSRISSLYDDKAYSNSHRLQKAADGRIYSEATSENKIYCYSEDERGRPVVIDTLPLRSAKGDRLSHFPSLPLTYARVPRLSVKPSCVNEPVYVAVENALTDSLYWFIDGQALDSFCKSTHFLPSHEGNYSITLQRVIQGKVDYVEQDVIIEDLSKLKAHYLLCNKDSVLVRKNKTEEQWSWLDGYQSNNRYLRPKEQVSLQRSIGLCIDTIKFQIEGIECMDDSLALCESYPLIIELETDAIDSVQWKVSEQFGSSTEPQIQCSLQTGQYNLELRYFKDKDSLDQLSKLKINPTPFFTLDSFLSICAGTSIGVSTEPHVLALWGTGETGDSIVPLHHGTYSLELHNDFCSHLLTTEVYIKDCQCDLFIPNAFSPNSDAHNPNFGPVYNCEMKDYHLQIYSRWGEKLFESTDPSIRWDGSYLGIDLPQSVYLYQLMFTDPNGQRLQHSGDILLLK